MLYVLPFAIYLGLTQLAARGGSSYPMLYAVAVACTGIATLVCLRREQPLVVHGRVMVGVAAGLLGIALWIALASLRLEQAVAAYLPNWIAPAPRAGFNPFSELPPLAAWTFVVLRIAGLAILVPLVEELFWRGFLARWLVPAEWRSVPIGRFTTTSFLLVTLLFTLAHPEWLAAAVYCTLLNALLWWKRDLWQCVVAHATSNAVLAAYVISSQAWWLW